MITSRQALEFLAANGCVRGAAEVVTQAVAQINVIEAVEKLGGELIQREASQQWKPEFEKLAILLGCDEDMTTRFISSFSLPENIQRLEISFMRAFEASGGLTMASVFGGAPDPTTVIAKAVSLFSTGRLS